MDTVTLTPAEYDATKNKLATINNRAAKRGFTGRFELHATSREVQANEEDAFPATEIVYDVSVTGVPPRYEGWNLVASVEFERHAEPLVHTAPGVDLIDRSTLRAGACDHCEQNRNRRYVYLLRGDDGKQIQVGKTCMKDFLGWDGMPVFHSARSVRDELEEFAAGSGGPRSYTPETVLAAAWVAIKAMGGYRDGIRSAVVAMMSPKSSLDGKHLRAMREHLDEAREQARVIREWVLSDEFEATSEYARNLKIVAASEHVEGRDLGLLVSAPKAWLRHRDEVIRREQTLNEHVGQEGDKLTVRVRVTSINWTDNNYGGKVQRTTIYTLSDEQGRVYKWFSSNAALGDEVSDEYVSLTGKVKAHREWKDVKETHLTRCKLL